MTNKEVYRMKEDSQVACEATLLLGEKYQELQILAESGQRITMPKLIRFLDRFREEDRRLAVRLNNLGRYGGRVCEAVPQERNNQ